MEDISIDLTDDEKSAIVAFAIRVMNERFYLITNLENISKDLLCSLESKGIVNTAPLPNPIMQNPNELFYFLTPLGRVTRTVLLKNPYSWQ